MLVTFGFYLGYLEVRLQVVFIVLHSRLLRQFIGAVDTERHLNSRSAIIDNMVKISS